MCRLLTILTLTLALASCTLPSGNDPLTAPDTPLPQNVTAADLLLPPAPIECVNVVQLPALSDTPAGGKRLAPVLVQARAVAGKTVSPIAVVTQAQKAALVQPDATTYHGRTADAWYTWQPGAIYTVLLAPAQTTVITLPPKEVLLVGLVLDEHDFVVVNKKVGKEDFRYLVTITPQAEAKGEYLVALISEAGHQFRLKLIVGTVAMPGVNFDVPQVHEATP